MRINIIIPDEDLRTLDDYCDRNGYKRSSFLVLAARRLMEQEIADPRLKRVQEVPKPVQEKIDSEVNRVLHEVKKKQEVKGSEVCKHGRMKGLCEYGCK